MTHDLSERSWGNNYTVQKIEDGGHKISLVGWRLGINNGDYLILKSGEDTTRYQVDSINYCSDPKDMWFAEASFSPRQ